MPPGLGETPAAPAPADPAPGRSRVDPLAAFYLGLPFVALLAVPLYDRRDPTLFGFPFFYWYQLAWVPLTSGLIYLAARRRA